VNVGQIYTTLDRLVRDGYVSSAGDSRDGLAMYEITDQGRTALECWYVTPITKTDRPRSELAIKLAMATADPRVDIAVVVQKQRTESMRQMRDYTDLRRHANDSGDLIWPLFLDHLIFALESEIRWLDHAEAMVLRREQIQPASDLTPAVSEAPLSGQVQR